MWEGMASLTQTSDKPFDRLTRLCADITKPLDEPENEDVKGIVFLHDAEKSGIQIHGYEEQMDAVIDLFIYMQHIFESLGKRLELIAIPESPEGLDGRS